MPLTDKEAIAKLTALVGQISAEGKERHARLEAEVRELRTLIQPPAPAPVRTTAPPAWAAPQGDYGANYGGPPSTPQLVTRGGSGIVGVEKDPHTGRWKDPSGQWRDSEGALVTPVTGIPVRGPERSPAHEQAIRLADELFDKE
jgi:hypothetical protein